MAAAPADALASRDVGNADWRVLSALWGPVTSAVALRAYRGDGHAECSLRRETLEERAAMSATAVKRALRSLLDLGWVERAQVDLGRGLVKGWYLFGRTARNRSVLVLKRTENGPKKGPKTARTENGPDRKRPIKRAEFGPKRGPNSAPEFLVELSNKTSCSYPREVVSQIRLGPVATRLADSMMSAQRASGWPATRYKITLAIEGDLLSALQNADRDTAIAVPRITAVVDGLIAAVRAHDPEAIARWGDRAFAPSWLSTTEAIATRSTRATSSGGESVGESVGDDGSVVRIISGDKDWLDLGGAG